MNARERLAAEALRLFVERGYDAVGVQEIVEAAGVTKPTLYHHFGSKRGLLVELAAGIDTTLRATVKPALVYAHDMPRDLEQLIARLLEYGSSRPLQMRLLLAATYAPVESEMKAVLGPVWDRMVADIERFFREGAGDHGNMRGRHRELTVGLLGTVLAHTVLELDGRLAPAEMNPHRIMRQFSYGIYA